MNTRELLQTVSEQGSQKMDAFGLEPLAFIMGMSLLSSLFISAIYLKAYRNRPTGSSIHRAFPLLGPAITAVFICIQFSLPLSLGLLGALSIVRFRTPIKEPEEIGFLMIVVAASLCCATFNLMFLGIVLATAVVALLLLNLKLKLLTATVHDGLVIVALPRAQYDESKGRLLELLQQNMPRGRVDSITEHDDEAVINYSFLGMKKKSLPSLEGLRTDFPGARLNVYFHHGGEI